MSVLSVQQKALEANNGTTGTSGTAALKNSVAIAEEFLSVLSQNGIQVSGTAVMVSGGGLAGHIGTTPTVKPQPKPNVKPMEKSTVTPAESMPVSTKPEAPSPRDPTQTKPSAGESPVAPQKEPASADINASVTPKRDNDPIDEDTLVANPSDAQATVAPIPVSQPTVPSPTGDTTVEVRPAGNPQQAEEGAPTTSTPQNQDTKGTKPTAPLSATDSPAVDIPEDEEVLPTAGLRPQAANATGNPVADVPATTMEIEEPTIISPTPNDGATPIIAAHPSDTASIPLPADIAELAEVPLESGVVERLAAAALRPASPATPAVTEAAPAVAADTDTPTPTVTTHDATAKTTTDLAAQQAANLARQLEENGDAIRVRVKVTDENGAVVAPVKPEANGTPAANLNPPTQGKPVTGETPLTPTQPQNANQQNTNQNPSGQNPSGQNPAGTLAGQTVPLNGVQDPRQILPEGQKFANLTKGTDPLPAQPLSGGTSQPAGTPAGAAPLGVQFGDLAGRPQATPLAHAPRTAPQLQQQVMEQLNVQIQKQVSEGKDLIKVQLRPAELGRIEVRLEVSSDGKVMAHVVADNKDTLQLLQKDQSGLEKALRDAGLDVNSNALSFSWRGDQQQGGQEGRQGRRNSRIKTGTDATTEAIIAQQEAARAARNRSGVDIKV